MSYLVDTDQLASFLNGLPEAEELITLWSPPDCSSVSSRTERSTMGSTAVQIPTGENEPSNRHYGGLRSSRPLGRS